MSVSSSKHFPVSSWDFVYLTCFVVRGLAFLLGIPGNIAVIILKPNIQQLSPVTRSLMLSLAVTDLLYLLTVPFGIYAFFIDWSLELVPCRLLIYLMNASIYGSLMTVTLLSVQRYLVVVKQRNTLNRFGPKRLLVLFWMASVIAPIPRCIALEREIYYGKVYCNLNNQALNMVALIEEITGGFIAMFIVTFSYICVYRKVKQVAFFNNPQTTKLVFSITVITFVSFVPYCVNNLLSVTADSLKMYDLREFCSNFQNITLTIVSLNCCLNPFLYAFTSCNCQKCSENCDCCGRNSNVSQKQSNITFIDVLR